MDIKSCLAFYVKILLDGVEPRDIYHHYLPELKQLMKAGLGKHNVPDNQRFNEPNELLEVPGAYIKP